MMKPVFAAVVSLSVAFATPVFAASPTTAQKQEFFDVCFTISQNQDLCACKADAAMKLIDERFMGVVIASMKGGSPKSEDYAAYNAYVAKSNQVCKPNY
jgi:hypothetical protein